MTHVNVEVSDHIATVTLDRPPVNAVDRATLAEIGEVFAHLGDDRDVRAAIFTAAGTKAFMAGADLRSMGDDDRDQWPAAWVTDQGSGRPGRRSGRSTTVRSPSSPPSTARPSAPGSRSPRCAT